MARYKTCLAQECCCGIRPIASVLRRTAHPELLTSRRRIPRATTKMRPLRLQMWLKFNILERKKKRKKNYLHCVLYKIYIYDPLSYLIFFICVLDPIWYPLITKSFEWMTSFRNYTNMNDKRTFLILRPLHALIQTSWGFRFQGSFIDTVNALNETVLPWAELVPFVLATPSVKLSYFKIALRGIMCISGTLHD